MKKQMAKEGKKMAKDIKKVAKEVEKHEGKERKTVYKSKGKK